MKVPKKWLSELVDLKVSIEQVEKLLPLRTIDTKEITETFIELDMKGYNRADLLSMRGVAYEVAAITNSKITFAETTEDEYVWSNQDLPKIPVEVKSSDLCPVYCLARIENLEVKPSPPEWVAKLEASGMRSVNNIVDVTNLIMLEFGQPLHAFDHSTIKDGKIIVRTAQEGEQLITLDGKKRALVATDLVIADNEKAVGLAGVMGGQNSEISSSPQAPHIVGVFLEAAIFDPITLRRTANRLGLYSEASKRFQHGLTKKRLLQALNDAISLLGGKLTALTIVDNLTETERSLQLHTKKVKNLLGIDISDQQIEDYLTKLHFVVDKSGDEWKITVPYFRLDIELEEDLIEEIVRMYGYENIQSQELPGTPPAPIDQKLFDFLTTLKSQLSTIGLTEVETYSFYSDQSIKNLQSDLSQLLKLTNPMSAETEYLRQNIWPNLLEVVAKNIRQGYDDIAIFEVGKVYYPQKDSLPRETYRLSLALMNGSDNPSTELNEISKKLPPELHGVISSQPNAQYFHPTRQTDKVAEVHPRLLFRYGISHRVAIAEFDLDLSK